MDDKEINAMNNKELDDELFREMINSWDIKTLINYMIDNMNREEKLNWVMDWYNE